MTTKKKEKPSLVTNSNVNNINVNVDTQKKDRKAYNKKKEDKPNWVKKAIVISLIGILLTFLFNYLLRELDGGHGKQPGVYNQP